jgi:twitching motility protein PilT
MDINELLRQMVGAKASDLHLQVASPPMLRVDGVIQPMEGIAPLTVEDLETIFITIANEKRRAAFQQELELDCPYSIPDLSRFRVNVLKQRGTLCMAFRTVPFTLPSIEDTGFPSACKDLILKPRGLILVTGPTGSGKSTTLAALINYLNETTPRTVITIEDPIEYLFNNKNCLISQRDVGDDTHSFARALKSALRHDPQVLVIGELRDIETIGIAITAAETGHLVLGTLHTIDAVQTIARLLNVFPLDQQTQVRIQLTDVIEAVISQRLLPRIGGGRAAAFEIMIANSAIKKLILNGNLSEIPANMDMSSMDGMQTMDKALATLVSAKTVTMEDAVFKCTSRIMLERHLHRMEEDLLTGIPVGTC